MKRIIAGLFFAAVFLYNGVARAEARAALLMEYETGRVLYAQNAGEPLPMASTTKIMTALLALENAALDERVTAGKNAFGVPGTSIYLAEGETLTMEEMLLGLMLSSGNDAAVAIAEHVGGTAENFCRMMTARAQAIGCEDTVFLTPHGLPAAGHHTTARDLTLIAREALRLPAFRRIVSTQRATIPWAGHEYSRVLTNKNRLLTSYPGAIGVKTGYTRAAGRCLVFAAEREGMTLVGAVLNCPDWFDEAEALLDRGFDGWRMAAVLEKGEAVRRVPVEKGTKESVTAVAARALAAPMPKGQWPTLQIDLPAALPAGLKKGQEIGAAALLDGGETLISVPLVAGEDVPADTFLFRLFRIGCSWPCAE